MPARVIFLLSGLVMSMALATVAAAPVAARDWFVRTGSAGGDGTRDKPFADPCLALEKAEAGDAIHVAAGVYGGRLDVPNYVLAVPNLKLLGGYDQAFAERDPWKNHTQLRFKKDAKNRATGTLVSGEKDHTGCVVDGFILDQLEKNTYADGAYGDIVMHVCCKDVIVRFSSPGVEVRNCAILNGSGDGVLLTGEGSRFENNLVMNMAGTCLVEVRNLKATKATVLKNNTFLLAWSGNFGQGGTDGSGLRLTADAKVEVLNNVFQGCDNHGVFVATKPERVVLKDNVFWLNSYSNAKFYLDGRDVGVDNANMGDLEEVGFKACEGNEAKDPGLGGLDPKWMEKYINRTAAVRGKVTMDEWNKLRQLCGAPLIAEGGSGPTGFAMAYDWQQALKLVPKDEAVGAHPKRLEVSFAAAGPLAVAPAASYERVTWERLLKDPAALADRLVEVPGAIGSGKSWYPIAGFDEKVWAGFELWDLTPREAARPPVVYVKRGTNAEKVYDGASAWSGSGKPPARFLFRGQVKYDAASTTFFKGTLAIEAIEPFVEAAAVVARPVGRDWFVLAGASGGNGTKEKPFKDPWQALEKALPGDAIHVAEGEYFGKLKCGYWTVDTRYLTLLGGYDKDFTERDPWKRPTKLGFAAGSKAWTAGSYLRTEYDHTGCILDGFVLDGSEVSKYQDGSLRPDLSARRDLVVFTSPDCELRNCVLVNGSLGSVSFSGEGGRIENCIMLNFHWHSVQLTPGKADKPYVLRNNTLLFTWYDRADGTGRTPVGSAVYARGELPLELDGNVIGYNDTQGVCADFAFKRSKITNNVFVRNLFAHLSDAKNTVIDDETLPRIGEAGLVASGGNVSMDPKLTLDKDWMKLYLTRTMTMPGKVKLDDWNNLRDFLGLPQVAEGGRFATNYCPIYPWRAAMGVFPQDPACTAGARPLKLEVRFNPNPPAPEPEKTYQTVEWPVLQNQIGTVAGKDVEFVGRVGEGNGSFYLDGVTAADGWRGISLFGPAGKESGLPAQGYFKVDSRVEKTLRKADDSPFTFRGTARTGQGFGRGCLLLDQVEKVE